MAMYHMKKIPSKNIVFCAFWSHNKIKIKKLVTDRTIQCNFRRFWPSDPHFNSQKALVWQVHNVVFAYVSYNKNSIKNIVFWAFCSHNKLNIGVLAPIFGHPFFTHNLAIFAPIPKKIIWGCSVDHYLEAQLPFK